MRRKHRSRQTFTSAKDVSGPHFLLNGDCQIAKHAYHPELRTMDKPKRPANIEELITRARAEDPAARHELLVYAQAYLRRKARFEKATSARGQSDLGQDAIERVINGLAKIPVTTGDNFDAWLNKILLNRVHEIHRNETRDKRDNRCVAFIEDLGPDATLPGQKRPSENAAANETTVKLWAAIFRLPKDQKRAVVRMQLDGLNIAEVADEMGKTQKIVGGLLQRGMAELKAQFSPDEPAIKRRVSRTVREQWAHIICEYCLLRDANPKIDIDVFLAKHAPGDENVRSFLEWLERIRESKA